MFSSKGSLSNRTIFGESIFDSLEIVNDGIALDIFNSSFESILKVDTSSGGTVTISNLNLSGGIQSDTIDVKTINAIAPATDIAINGNLNMNGTLLKNVFSISNDNDGEVLIQGSSGVDALLVGDGNIISSVPLTISTNGKSSFIDNDFNTFEAGSANYFNVDLGGAHDFVINNQQKFTVTNTQLEARTKLTMFGANQIQCTNFTTDISSNLNFLIDGETLNFRRFGGGLDIGWSDGNIVFETNNLDMNSNNLLNAPLIRGDINISIETDEGASSGIYIASGGDIIFYKPTRINDPLNIVTNGLTTTFDNDANNINATNEMNFNITQTTGTYIFSIDSIETFKIQELVNTSSVNLNMSNNNITNVSNLQTSTINNYTPTLSIARGISSSAAISTGEVSLIPTSINGTTTIAANTISVGDTFKMIAWGEVSTNTASEPLTIRWKWAGSTIRSEVINPTPSITSGYFKIETEITFRTIGATCTYYALINTTFRGGGLSSTGSWEQEGQFSTTSIINATINNIIDLTGQWTNSGVNNIQSQGFILYKM